MGSIFKFKQFEVNQSGCAMKINTDGVLLGAIAGKAKTGRILDIGTGTGVIAMMLAQRFPDAHIDAIEIDESAALAARNNFKASPFSGRLQVFHNSVASFETDKKYDLVVSNPPYFVNDLKNVEHRKQIARHADGHFFESLLLKVNELLTDDGLLWLILPVKQADFVMKQAEAAGLFLRGQVNICSDINKPVIRRILCLGRIKEMFEPQMFYIYKEDGQHTSCYKALLKDFFLAF